MAGRRITHANRQADLSGRAITMQTLWDNETAYEADCRRTTLWRKVQEVPWSIAITARYGREGVQQVYLNRAYFGAGAYGVTAAMERYFDATPAEATPQQAAMLVGLLTAPSRFAPTNDLERSQGRAGVVLGLMARSGYLTEAELAAARAAPATLSPGATEPRGGAFADWIMREGPGVSDRRDDRGCCVADHVRPRDPGRGRGRGGAHLCRRGPRGSEAEAAS